MTKAPLPSLDNQRGYWAAALVALRDSGVTGAVNVASGEPVSLREICRASPPNWSGSTSCALGAVPSHPHDASLVVADVTRFSEGVRWQPSYDLDRGLDTTIVVGGATTRGSPRQAVTEI